MAHLNSWHQHHLWLSRILKLFPTASYIPPQVPTYVLNKIEKPNLQWTSDNSDPSGLGHFIWIRQGFQLCEVKTMKLVECTEKFIRIERGSELRESESSKVYCSYNFFRLTTRAHEKIARFLIQRRWMDPFIHRRRQQFFSLDLYETAELFHDVIPLRRYTTARVLWTNKSRNRREKHRYE